MTIIDNYLQKIELVKRKPLERIREIAKKVLPEAHETISYGMPTLKYRGKSFLGFDAHKNHIGIYPFGGEEIEVFKEKLSGYEVTKGSIHVPYGKVFPETLLKAIIKHRIKRIIQN